MKAFAKLMILTVALTTASQAQAQQSTLVQPESNARVQGSQQCYVNPGVQPQPQPQNPFYFGVNVQLMRGYAGTTLRIVSVTPGSPAQRAGLEVGDEIRTVNGRGFKYATDSFDAVRRMNQYVTQSFVGGPAPATAPAAAAAVAPGVQAFVAPPQSSSNVAMMIVRNVRTGGNVSVPVYPTPRFPTQPGFGPAPAAAATVSPQAGG